jgi:hypothetical protein
VVAGSIIVACGFSNRAGDDDTIPDGPCTSAPSFACAGDALRACMTVGSNPIETACKWGCVDEGTAHCGRVAPVGGVATEMDMRPEMFDGLGAVVIESGATIDGNAGTITGVANGMFKRDDRGGKALFRFKRLTINGDVELVGTGAIVLAADEEITLDGIVDARGPCGSGDAAITPGPGGFAGAMTAREAGQGPDNIGGGGGSDTAGAGGGGNGGNGGSGGGGAGAGPVGTGGASVPATVAKLVGGGGGGASDGGGGRGRGGGGGGALQLVSNTKIVLVSGGINAGGCGGDSGNGTAMEGGGGGGAGGTIVLEAPLIDGSDSVLAVNGGAGGGGDSSSGATGQPGRLDRTQAASVASTGFGGPGGSGAAGAISNGVTPNTVDNRGGGGGGGIGRIQLNTKSGSFSASSMSWSPRPTESGFSNGSATVH